MPRMISRSTSLRARTRGIWSRSATASPVAAGQGLVVGGTVGRGPLREGATKSHGSLECIVPFSTGKLFDVRSGGEK